MSHRPCAAPPAPGGRPSMVGRPPLPAGTASRPARLGAGRGARALALALALSGCVRAGGSLPRPSPETLPPASPLRSVTLADGDAWLRHHLMYREHEQALQIVRSSPVAPADRLLRALQEGVVLHQAGNHARSNEVLDWAELEADRRYTRSVSRAVASLATSDRTLAYTPSAAELVMIPYYRMLNYLALGDHAGALVEARKATALVARLERGGVARCREDGLVLYLAGLVQHAAGERNDALVSLRQAEQAFRACSEAGVAVPGVDIGPDLHRAARALGLREVADSVAERYGLSAGPVERAGDLVLLVEHGFVAHRAQEALHVPIYSGDTDGLDGDDEDGVVEVAGRVAERLLSNLSDRAAWGGSADDHPVMQWGHALAGAYVLRLAWPVLRLEAGGPARVRVLVGEQEVPASTVGDLSTVVEREMAADRPAMLARLVARGLTKYLLTRGAEETAEEKGGEFAAFVIGRLGNLAANELERADTRSWSLLPDRISMTRLRLPPGVHRVRLEIAGRDGQVEVCDLGTVSIEPDRMVVLSHRVWGKE